MNKSARLLVVSLISYNLHCREKREKNDDYIPHPELNRPLISEFNNICGELEKSAKDTYVPLR